MVRAIPVSTNYKKMEKSTNIQNIHHRIMNRTTTHPHYALYNRQLACMVYDVPQWYNLCQMDYNVSTFPI